MAPPQESEEEDNEFIDDTSRYDHYDKIKKRMYIIKDEIDQYSNIRKELHAPNTFLISIRMHSELDNLFSDWAPEWAYSPYVSKRLFSPTMEIVKVAPGDIGCNTLAGWNGGDVSGSIYAQTIQSEADMYFYRPETSLATFTSWFMRDFPRTLRNNHRDPTITPSPNVISFYKTHSKTLDDPYNPMNINNIQTITKTSNSELINKHYYIYKDDAFFKIEKKKLHIVTSAIYDMRGVQIVNLNNGKIYNIATVEGVRKILTDYHINSESNIRKILSNNPETIPFELFSQYSNGVKTRLKYHGLIHFFSEMTMANIVEILNLIGSEKVFIADGSCSGLTNLKHVKTIKDRNAFGRKQTKNHKKKYKRKTLKYKR